MHGSAGGRVGAGAGQGSDVGVTGAVRELKGRMEAGRPRRQVTGIDEKLP